MVAAAKRLVRMLEELGRVTDERGSKGFTGQLRAGDLALRDADGISVREALSGKRRDVMTLAKRVRKNWLGYLEVHIEQGPALESASAAVGVVSGIAGQTRGRKVF